MKLSGTDGQRFYSWELASGEYKVGRDQACNFYIPNKTVSRNHALLEIDIDGEEIYLRDLGSRNGTFINDSKISGRVSVRPGDKIMFGHTEFKISIAEEAAPLSPSFPRTVLSDEEPRKSVYLPINEALKPLPKKVSDLPDLIPTMFDMAKMLVLDEPQEVMLERSLAMIAKIIPAEKLVVLFVSEDQNEVYTAATLLPEGQDPGELTLSRTIVNEIITNKNSILITDPKDDPRFADQQSIIMSELKSAMAVPLFDEGKVLGILYADTTKPLHVYNDDYLRVLATFGNIIASKLLNYTLIDERQAKRVMEAELDRASLIQKTLLVAEPPCVEGYEVHAFQEQSRSVGGDMYDFRLLKDGQLLFLVADVSGKGMGAALLMSNILASFRILYESDSIDLSDMVSRVSLQLLNHSDAGDFATLFIGLLNPADGAVRFINAGHNPPILIRSDAKLETLNPGGAMIGAFDFTTWEVKTIRLSRGDMILVYTDGVTEAESGDGMYGEERMRQQATDAKNLPLEEVAIRLLDDIKCFTKDMPQSDDITMLLLRKEKE